MAFGKLYRLKHRAGDVYFVQDYKEYIKEIEVEEANKKFNIRY